MQPLPIPDASVEPTSVPQSSTHPLAEAWSLSWTLATLAIPSTMAMALTHGGLWAWAIPVGITGVIPFVDTVLRAVWRPEWDASGETPPALVPVYTAVQIVFAVVSPVLFWWLLQTLETQGLTL